MKNLKIKVCVLIGIVLFTIILFTNKSKASTSATYFYGEPIVIEYNNNLEIISNEIKIDTEKSKIENLFLLKNNSDKDVTSKISIKLEDSKLSTSINNLKIVVNKTEITNASKENGIYTFSVKVPKKEGKKINISYITDNQLRNAKVIKYTLDNLKGKKIKHFKIDIVLPEVDVPLVTGIYPECYKFNNNTVSVEYYNFSVNALTKDFIIEKETYKNLLYGHEVELNDLERKVLEKAESWIKNGLGDGKSTYRSYLEKYQSGVIETILTKEFNVNTSTIREKVIDGDDDTGKSKIKAVKSIIEYSEAKLYEKEKLGERLDITYVAREDYPYPLTAEYMEKVKKDECPLYGLTLAVDYIKTEGNKELYVYKNTSGSIDDYISDYKYVKTDEWDILKTKNRAMWYDLDERRGLKVIHINQDITGAEIEATDEEKVEYVNMINPSLYVRVTIYDGDVIDRENSNNEEEYYPIKTPTGYYGKENLAIAKSYNINTRLNQKYDQDERNIEYEMNSIYVDYDNDIIANKCEVPNLAHNIGYREKKDGKYVVTYLSQSYHADGFGNVKKAANCDRAKELKQKNEKRLSAERKQVNDEISKLVIDETIGENINENNYVKNNETQNNGSETVKNSLSKTDFKIDMIVYGTVIGGIIVLSIVIVIILIKRGKK